MSSSDDATRTVLIASALVDREGGLVPFIRNVGFGGVAFAFILQLVRVIDGFGSVLFGIPKAFGLGVILLIEVFFSTSGAVLGAGAEASIRSFSTGLAGLLGPFAQPFAVGTVMLSVGVFLFAVRRLSFNPLAFFTRSD